MMNALTRAAATAVRKIPPQILNYVFLPASNPWNNLPNALEFQVLEKVIRPRVLVDCDILGGIEDYIRLTGLPFERTPQMTSVVRVPKDRTNGRTITSVLYLNYLDYTANTNSNALLNFNNCSITPLSSAAGALAGSYSGTGGMGTARIELIAENTVHIKEPIYSPQNATLRCVLSNDAELNNLSVRTYVEFGELCALAIKSYIWTQSIVDMSQGVAQAGVSISAFSDIISRYEAAEDEYITYLKKWKRILFMNDRETYNRFIRGMISVGH